MIQEHKFGLVWPLAVLQGNSDIDSTDYNEEGAATVFINRATIWTSPETASEMHPEAEAPGQFIFSVHLCFYLLGKQ